MNTLYKLITLLIFTASFAVAQSVEFEKSNFPDKKDQLKEAKKNLDDGKDAFELGMKEYGVILDWYTSKNKYYPVSRKDYQRAGDIYFKEAQPLLTKAQDFNPNNAYLNYMLGVISFNLNPQSDNAVKYLEKALSLNDPKLPEELTYFLGWACQFQLKWDDAIKYYQMQLAILNKDAKGNAMAIEDANKKIAECKIGKKETTNPQRVFVDNLGSSINTSYPEYSAFITADESMMVLTARRENTTGGKIDNDKWPYEDLYQSFKTNGKWSPAQNFGSIVNT